MNENRKGFEEHAIIKVAKVVDNTDETNYGKIKVRILPEMSDFDEDMLPWASVYSYNGTGTADSQGQHRVFEIDSFVRVLIEDYPQMKNLYVISDDCVDGLHPYSKLDLSGISEMSSQTYPQPEFKMYADGTITFHNTDTGETGTFYKNGGYYFIDSDGNMFVNAGDQEIKLYNSKGSLDLDTDGKLTLDFNSDLDITSSGAITLSGSSGITIKDSSSISIEGGTVDISGSTVTISGSTSTKITGTVTPTGSGPLCGLPLCLFTGASQTGNTAVGG